MTPVVSPAPVAPPGVPVAALRGLHWTALPADPLGPRELTTTAWTGREFLAVGGAPVSGDGSGFTRADAYDPQTDAWNPLPSFPLAARVEPASVWTGYGLLIWGGATSPGGARASRALADGAVLDMTSRRWHVMTKAPLPALESPVAVTDGADRVIVLGGETPGGEGETAGSPLVARYDPANGTWQRLPSLPAVRGQDLRSVSAVRWGSRILVAETWQHVVHLAPGATSSTAGVHLLLLDATETRWSTLPSSAPFGADLRPLGSLLAIGGGTSCPPSAFCPAELNSPFTLVDAQGRNLSGIPFPPIEFRAETAAGDSYVAMTGSQITGPGRDEQPGDAAAFDPMTKRWVLLPSARRFKPEPESLTWTGRELIEQSPTGLLALGPS